jgi:hypothetical protein
MKISNFKYFVTFNNGELGVGDEHEMTVDFVGNNIVELAQEVIDGDSQFPMKFISGQYPGMPENVVGVFIEIGLDPEDECPTAVMYT